MTGLAGDMPQRTGSLLVVDDDETILRMMVDFLGDNGFSVLSAASRAEMRRHLTHAQVSLVILDVQLGQDDGFDVLREIRSGSDVPVVILTGHRRDEIDRVVGLELGADDYLTKPFSLRELMARIRAILRRQEFGRTQRNRDPERGGYRFAGWQLARRHRRLTDPSGNLVPLTKGEYTLLHAFLESPQRPLSRERLLQVTRVHEDVFDRSIDVQVLRLRRKLEADPSAPQMILTERGIGYVFAARVEPF
ncbi:response regulator [Acuticoccus yangtzensis]|uniref:response regulator n=1 Tax=Acuticoccus yangtzensis TaxID=1443441 RepID=UPI001FE2FC06|nr:response regulator [Acuticoccus yangtzensis]